MKRPAVLVPGRPVRIKFGSVTVTLYSEKNCVRKVVYHQYAVVYYEGGQRRRRRFSDYTDAYQEAQFVAEKVAAGETEILQLGPADRAVYLEALRQVQPVGVPLSLAATVYAAAVQRLPAGTTLKEAVEFFRRRNPTTLERRTVTQVVEELIAAKRNANLSDVHVRDLESRLRRFATAFQIDMGMITGSQLQEWLDRQAVSGRTKHNKVDPDRWTTFGRS